jgi:integrase
MDFGKSAMTSIRKRTLPSGKVVWQADYRDSGGARRSRQFSKKSEADAFMVTTRAQVAAGTHVADSASITLDKAAELWIQRAEIEKLEASTIRQYRQHANLHIVPLIGAVKLSRLTKPAVEHFRDELLKTRSRALARAILTSLKGILKEAQRRGLVGQNVAADTQVRTSSRDDEEVEIPSREHIRTILDKVPGKWRPLIVTALFTGLRCSELRGLTWQHVDLKAAVIKVRQRADFANVIGPPKSRAGRRDVPLSPMVVNALKAWKLACPKGGSNPLDLVFPSSNGNIQTNSNIWKYCWTPLQLSSGMVDRAGEVTKTAEGHPICELRPRYGFHSLRHAAASLFIEQGWSPKKVQVVMGHSSIQITFDTYGHLWPSADDDRKALAEIEARLMWASNTDAT